MLTVYFSTWLLAGARARWMSQSTSLLAYYLLACLLTCSLSYLPGARVHGRHVRLVLRRLQHHEVHLVGGGVYSECSKYSQLTTLCSLRLLRLLHSLGLPRALRARGGVQPRAGGIPRRRG